MKLEAIDTKVERAKFLINLLKVCELLVLEEQ